MTRRKPQPVDPLAWMADLAVSVISGGLMGSALGITIAVAFDSIPAGFLIGCAATGVLIALIRG